jgi:hypothetical protein
VNVDVDDRSVHRFDDAIDAEPAPGREIDDNRSDRPTGREASQNGIVIRDGGQPAIDGETLRVGAVDETRFAAPHRCPQVSIVSGGRERDQALTREKGASAGGNLRGDADAVASCGVALTGPLLDGDFAGMEGLAGHEAIVQNVRYNNKEQRDVVAGAGGCERVLLRSLRASTAVLAFQSDNALALPV